MTDAVLNTMAGFFGADKVAITDVQGTVIGKKVAHWLRKHYFQPLR